MQKGYNCTLYRAFRAPLPKRIFKRFNILAKKLDPQAIPTDLPFEDAVAELESILQSMENGQLPLEASLNAYRRGALLLRHAQQQLADADERLRVLENDTLKPLALDGDASA